MKLFYSLLGLLVLASCKKQAIYVPQSDVTLLTEMADYSNIAMLYNLQNDSVQIDVKDDATITQTNWLFEVDKRLPLYLVIPEVKRLQDKKYKKAAEEMMPNFYTYMDTVAKTVAFMPIEHVVYELGAKPNLQENARTNQILTIDKNGAVFLADELVDLKQINAVLNQKFPEQPVVLSLAFDKNITFETYLQTKLNLTKISLPNVRIATTEMVY
ncbi:hypothetical protein K5I29_04570 [Flavobacterium agricola]|uniref:Uncharacterized protein n=1 Tax=Flavobacterium agricola TaxID=2870839 RepID=A0ABY6M0U8_9FLAO|nr:hypothetical protein [Flavobacterium agricola]UYW02182.1 hypothetical protein K5I29_04570 [Flavobacterium agricola]